LKKTKIGVMGKIVGKGQQKEPDREPCAPCGEAPNNVNSELEGAMYWWKQTGTGFRISRVASVQTGTQTGARGPCHLMAGTGPEGGIKIKAGKKLYHPPPPPHTPPPPNQDETVLKQGAAFEEALPNVRRKRWNARKRSKKNHLGGVSTRRRDKRGGFKHLSGGFGVECPEGHKLPRGRKKI